MGDNEDWPGLRFNPTPGIVPAIDSLVLQVRSASDHYSLLHADMDGASLNPTAWQGQAGSEFHAEVNELVPAIRTIKDALFNVRIALSGWSSLLSTYQTQARQLEDQAVAARARVGTAESAPGMGMAPHGFEEKADYDRKKSAYTAAKSELDAAKDDLDHLISLAKDLKEQHDESAKSTAKDIGSAMDRAKLDPKTLTSAPGTNPLDDAIRVADLLKRKGDDLSKEDAAWVKSMLDRYGNDPQFAIRLSQEVGTGPLVRLAVDNPELRPVIPQLTKGAGFNEYDLAVQYITEEMVKNGTGPEMDSMDKQYSPDGFMEWLERIPETVATLGLNIPAEKAAALAEFAWLVRPGGDWDHKPKFQNAFDIGTTTENQWITIPGRPDLQINYDVWSNIHYGYVGREAGFERDLLVFAQNLPGTGEHSEGDDLSVRLGMELYDQVRPGQLTSQDVTRLIEQNMAELIAKGNVKVNPNPAP